MSSETCIDHLYQATGFILAPTDFNCHYDILQDLSTDYKNLTLSCGGAQNDKNNSETSLINLITLTRKLLVAIGSFLILLNIGTKTSFKKCKGKFQKPLGMIIGFISQFTLMPLISLSIVYLFKAQLTKYQSFGLFICGCSPGGTLSNFVVGYVKGDINLSVAMTFTSQFASLFMMPLWIYVYSRVSYNFIDLDKFIQDLNRSDEIGSHNINDNSNNDQKSVDKLPIFGVLQALFLCVLAIYLGNKLMKLNNGKWKTSIKKYRGVVAKIGFMFIICNTILIFMTDPEISNRAEDIFFKIVPLTLFIPLFGMFLGWSLGYFTYNFICCQTKKKRLALSHPIFKTISIETGIQNVVIPGLMFNLNYDCPQVLSEMVAMALCFSISQFATLFMIFLVGKLLFNHGISEWKKQQDESSQVSHSIGNTEEESSSLNSSDNQNKFVENDIEKVTMNADRYVMSTPIVPLN